MWTKVCWRVVGLALLCGCGPPPSPPAAPPAPPPPYTLTLNLPQLMDWVIDPAADVVWGSVKWDMTMSGTKETMPKTDDDWATVRSGAATVIEAGNLLMIEGRARDRQEWMAAARRLSMAGEAVLKAVEAKDAEAVFAAGTEIDSACEACHDRYAFFDRKAPAPDPAASGGK